MNPDLVKAAREILAFRKMNPDMTPAEVEEIARHFGTTGEEATGYIAKLRGDGGNLVSSGLKGFTMNFGDELIGLLPDKLGGGEAGKEEFRLRNELAAEDHPVSAPVAEIGGGIATAVVTGGSAPLFTGGTRIANAAKSGAAIGGGYGAVSGAGRGEAMDERAKGAVVEGSVGALLGAGIGSAAARIADATPFGMALRRNLDAIQQSGGVQKVRQTLQQFRNAGRADEVVTADLSQPLQNAADFAANNSPPVYNKASKILNDRQPDITERMLGDVEAVVGKPLPDAVKRAQQLKDEKYDWANTAFGHLRENIEAVFQPADIGTHVKVPAVTRMLEQAQLADDIKSGGALEKLIKRVTSREAKLSFNDMHQLSRALDGKAGAAYRTGNVPLADAYKEVRDQVRVAIENKVPEYAATVGEYAAKSRLQEMLTKGVETWNKIGVRELADDLSKLNPADAEQFRYGLSSKLVDTLRDTNTNRNVAKGIMDKGVSMQEKLKVVFGTKDKFDDFMQRVQAESTMGETRNVVRGSSTAKRTADAFFDPLPALAGQAAFGPAGLIAGSLQHLRGVTGKRATEKTAAKMGEGLFIQGADKVDAFLEKLTQPISILGKRATKGIGYGAGIAAHAISSLFDRE